MEKAAVTDSVRKRDEINRTVGKVGSAETLKVKEVKKNHDIMEVGRRRKRKNCRNNSRLYARLFKRKKKN